MIAIHPRYRERLYTLEGYPHLQRELQKESGFSWDLAGL